MELADEMPWLAKSDRMITALAARLMVRIQTNPACQIGAFTELRLCRSEMGGTPTSQLWIRAADGDDGDPAERFFQ